MKSAPALMLVLLSVAFGLSCFDVSQPAPAKRSYVLQLDAPERAAEPVVDLVARLDRLRVASPFSGRGIVYRTGENRYEADFYHEFLAPPAQNIGTEIRLWLDRARVFERTVDGATDIRTDVRLDAEVRSLYADLRADPKAVLVIHFFVVHPEHGVIFEREYSEAVAVSESTPAAIVAGYNGALIKTLERFRADLGVAPIDVAPQNRREEDPEATYLPLSFGLTIIEPGP